MNNILIKIYWVILGLLVSLSVYQLINPHPVVMPDSSGLTIIRREYGVVFYLYCLYSLFFGFYLLHRFYKNKLQKLILYFSLVLILNIPFYLLLISLDSKLVSLVKNFSFVNNSFWQLLVLIYLLVIIGHGILGFISLKSLLRSK